MAKTEMTPAFSVKPGDVVTINGHDWLRVWTHSTLRGGTRVGLKFEERDGAGRRYYVNLPAAFEIGRKVT